MEYQLVLSPELDLSPYEILAAWDADPQACAAAEARIDTPMVKSFDPLLVAGVVAFVTTVATGVLTDLLSDVLKNALAKKFGEHEKHAHTHFKFRFQESPDGTRLLDVEMDEEQ
jgi:hypothetical protein